VALDTGGAAAARQWIDLAAPTHPALIDAAHLTDELFGFVNVPNAVWIDETGMIVRPAHPAHIRRAPMLDVEVPEGEGRRNQTLREVKKLRITPDLFLTAVRDWAANGSASRYALTPDQVIARSRPRLPAHAEAAAAFELGQHLWRAGRADDAVGWFRRAHALHPDNWTYKRQAWSFATTEPGQPSDMAQGPTDLYEGNWLADVQRIGAENYYEPFEP